LKLSQPDQPECGRKFHNLKKYQIGTENDLRQSTNNLRIFDPKSCNLALRSMCWIQIQEKFIPYPGVKKYYILDPDSQHGVPRILSYSGHLESGLM
jgi:hypothetical protein